MVPRLHAHALVDAVALRLPAGRVPVRRARRRERPRAAGSTPEYELLDTGVFDGGYWDIDVDYAKAAPDDIVRARCTSATSAPERATLARAADAVVPQHVVVGTSTAAVRASPPSDGALVAEHPTHGRMVLTSDGAATPLFCDNESNKRAAVGRRRAGATRRTASTTTSSTAPTR